MSKRCADCQLFSSLCQVAFAGDIYLFGPVGKEQGDQGQRKQHLRWSFQKGLVLTGGNVHKKLLAGEEIICEYMVMLTKEIGEY